MEHRIYLKNNSRLWVFIGIMLVLAAVAAWCLAQFGIVPGLVALACVAFLDFRIGKWLRNVLASGIETTDKGAEIKLSNGKSHFISMEELTVAGTYAEQGRPGLFLFADEKDQFFACSDIFSNFAQLDAWLRANAQFEEHGDLDMAGIKALLRSRFGEDESEPDAETETEAEPKD